jgi:hypothetical protein
MRYPRIDAEFSTIRAGGSLRPVRDSKHVYRNESNNSFAIMLAGFRATASSSMGTGRDHTTEDFARTTPSAKDAVCKALANGRASAGAWGASRSCGRGAGAPAARRGLK